MKDPGAIMEESRDQLVRITFATCRNHDARGLTVGLPAGIVI